MVLRGNKKRLINSQSFPKFPNPAERANVQVSSTKTIRSLLVTGLTSTLPRRTKETFRASPRFLLLTQSPPGWRNSPFQQGRVGSSRAGVTVACRPGGLTTRRLRLPPAEALAARSSHPAQQPPSTPTSNPAPGPAALGTDPLGAGVPGTRSRRAEGAAAGSHHYASPRRPRTLCPWPSPTHTPEGSPGPRTTPPDSTSPGSPEQGGLGQRDTSARARTHAPAPPPLPACGSHGGRRAARGHESPAPAPAPPPAPPAPRHV